ncbi:hypothetical protein F5Y04DRAFT_253383 [Hypomontagnella monticulosa]|nr:hypothetical protein F5Y04DRAFT_253383 [Hypomontagnella monticulosa]
MRVPLDSMEESVMPWPQPEPDQTVRNAFLKGKDVGEGLEFSLMCDVDTLSREPSNRRLFYKVTTTHKIRQTRIGNSVISWIAKFYFPLTTEKLAEALEILLQDWRLPGPFHNSEDNKALLENKPIFGLLQSFILGYYYGALGKLIDTSQLLLREAYGSWGWWDLEVLQVMRSIWDKPPPQDQTQSDFKYCWRVNLLRAMAYLFAGAEISLINRLNDHAVGVVAKLSLVSGSILGQSVDKITAARFHLLDVDTSCIPNNANLILSGEQPYSQRRSASTNLESLDNMELAEAREDFTAHIEPDWQHDANSCLVAYRDEGRMVQRFSPLNIDIAMVASQADNPEVRFHKDGLSKVFRIPTSNFRGGIVMMHPQDSEGLHASQPTDGNEPLMAPTLARPRARACIAAMIIG